MPPEDEPALPGWIEDAYIPLKQYLCEKPGRDSFTHQQATEIISEANPDFGDADVDHALDHLLNRGWLYQVDDRLYITELQCAESGK